MKNYEMLSANNASAAVTLVDQKQRFLNNFPSMKIEPPIVEGDLKGDIHVGDSFKVQVKVFLNELKPEDVDVQIYTGNVNVHNEIMTSSSLSMSVSQDLGGGYYIYEQTVVCKSSGRFGMTARITPKGDSWRNSVPGFICWPQ